MVATSRRPGFVGLGIETTQGTAVTPTIWVPSTTATPNDTIASMIDESVRANYARTQGLYAGSASTGFEQGGWIYPDTIGHLIRAIGFVDTSAAGSGGDVGKTIHSFALKPSQPDSYTIHNNDGLSSRAYPGCMISEAKINVDVTGNATVSTTWVGWPGADVTAATPTYTTVQPFLGWQLTATVDGSVTTKLTQCELTFNRDAEVIPGSNGTQSPRETFADGLKFTYTYSAEFDTIADRTRYLAYAEHAQILTLTKPTAAGGERITFTSTRNKLTNYTVDASNKYLTASVEGEGIYSITDAGPVKIQLANLVSTAY